MQTLQRAFQNRWLSAAATIAIGCVSLWFAAQVIEGAYYDYYLYPRLKGAEYIYPELRYTLGQAAILIWSAVGLCTAALAGRCALVRNGARLAARSTIAFALGFVLLTLGMVAGMAARDFGF